MENLHGVLDRVAGLLGDVRQLGAPVRYDREAYDRFFRWYDKNIKTECIGLVLDKSPDVRDLTTDDEWICSDEELQALRDYSKPGGKVWYVNTTIIDKNSTVSDEIGRKALHIPDGLSVFKEYMYPAIQDVQTELETLFRNEDASPTEYISMIVRRGRFNPETTFLFYTPEREYTRRMMVKDGVAEHAEDIKMVTVYPTCKDVIQRLYMSGYVLLASFLLDYAKSIAQALACDMSYVEESSVSFIRYKRGAGIRRHIDGVASFKDWFGPILTLAMGANGGKVMDMTPTLVDDPSAVPVRVTTRPYQTSMMQGQSRTEWSHSIPTGNTEDQYTIAFKFGLITTKHVVITERSGLLDCSYPTIVL